MGQGDRVGPDPIILVTGFLGSGKTTLLKRFLARHAGERKVAVVQNEFADGSVDGAELRRTGLPFELLEINRGSVFCVCLLSDFIGSLSAMVDRCRPGAVIVEATGLADPIAVAQLLQDRRLARRVLLSRVWAVVDASTFLRMEKAVGRVRQQVRVADTVVVNKVDLGRASLAEVAARVRGLNPFAEIIETSYAGIDLEGVFEASGAIPTAARNVKEAVPEGRPDITSAAVRFTRRISREALGRFLARYETGVLRLKGFVNLDDRTTLGVQSCFGRTVLRAVEGYEGPSEIVALGPGLDAAAFAADFESAR